ncbi:MmcQ/YjbR family DNA-binding protein [Chelativorans alearense]|uniref:MmcQ/YjbR family DNA-binding protein n=1 Tax=Chelativorans alearense TaxID=2681495 RepID=UPI0013D2606D|nr:MmcQ/YjbR family DNA-binding protein [Chelativorans alearense]
MSDGAWGKAFERLREAAAGLPEVEESTSYGTPSLKVRKKFLARVKDPETIVLMCPLEEKEMLLSAAPDIFYETDHYRGWPAILARIHRIAPDELRHRLERAWRMQAPKRLAAARDRGRESPSDS